MKPNHTTPDVATVRRAYGLFLDNGEIPEGLVPEFIRRSWRRSAAFGVPADAIREIGRIESAELRAVVDQFGSLISLAAPVMEALHQQMSGTGSVVLLCRGDGLILHSKGDPNFIPKAQQVALTPGVSWAEDQKGTNAIGTAIVERQSVVVFAAQHYIRQNHFLACSATPVLDPNGEVAGVLDITCDYRAHQPHTMALVQMAVRVIERQLFQHRFCRDVVFNVHPQRNYLGSPYDVQVAFSGNGDFLAASPATCSLIDMCPGSVRGHFDELFDTPFAQVLQRLTVVSPPVIQVRVLRNGMPVSMQLAQPAPGSGVERAGRNRAQPAPRALSAEERDGHDITLDVFGASDPVTLLNVEKARRTLGRDIRILIEGETGTGKEWLARAIHNSGTRASARFVVLNCAAITDAALDTALFGQGQVAIRDYQDPAGKIQQANGGTLFLDEIGDMPLNLQARLLQVLQEGAITRPDGVPVNANLAVICATHQKLRNLVLAGAFREDLYYRLNGLTLFLPPLRERRDLGELAIDIVARECAPSRRIEISPEVMEIFSRHPWPGNIRQLHSVVRAAIAMMLEGDVLQRWHLPEDFLSELGPPPEASQPVAEFTAAESLEQIERQVIENTIREYNGNISAAARRLHVSRTTLYRKLKPARSA